LISGFPRICFIAHEFARPHVDLLIMKKTLHSTISLASCVFSHFFLAAVLIGAFCMTRVFIAI
jgi:hypothetical protein